MIVGIGTGLGAALLQSLSYLATRYYVHGRGRRAARELLVVGHVWMGVASAILLIFVWPGRDFSPLQVWNPLLLMVAFYMVGQTAMTLALQQVEASRISPLQGVKIIFLAALAAFFPQPKLGMPDAPGLTGMQWCGAALAVAAAAMLNYAGKSLPRRALLTILVGCAGYALADWNIARTSVAIARLYPAISGGQASLINVGLCYGATGLLAAGMLPWWGSARKADWRDALPFAGAWFTGMLLLYWCYAEVGPLLGVILQSTRGLMSIVAGSLIVWWGHHHIEPQSGKGIFARRLAAGVLMFLAVSLYVIRDPGRLRISGGHSSEGRQWMVWRHFKILQPPPRACVNLARECRRPRTTDGTSC